eukprot:CAMPEP_0181427966 /NCGR_PEP_ID=MMETSP1110-20121109/16438_1 /TAXON_ID=174948 /ORGANISM="Symbiodinium sp., Strain CCMP421" /LENGTH=582 /DNA_ID=CAMNT_0023551183 /DNA_START=55 /DNA_END=1803 /DNA_ORIENTATION=+
MPAPWNSNQRPRGEMARDELEDVPDAEMGQRYRKFPSDSLQSHISEPQKAPKKRLVFHYRTLSPETSYFLEIWDGIFLLVLAAVSVITPLEVAFDLARHEESSMVIWAIDAAFLFDMILQFFTAYFDTARSRYVRDVRSIAWRYLTGWFVIDLATTFPYQLFGELQHLRVLRLLRLHSAIQICRRRQANVGISFALLSLIKFLVVLSFNCHWMACLWGHIAWCHREGSWLEALEASKGGDPRLYTEWPGVYTISVYWAIMTLTSIGYGDITPQNQYEYVVASVCMAFMAAMWAVVIGQMCGVLATLLPHDVAFKRTMDDLNWLLKDRQMPMPIRTKLRRYFYESRSLTRLHEQKQIIAQMSPMLQGEVSTQLLGNWIEKVGYLNNLDCEVLVQVARKLKAQLFAPKEAIDNDRALFVVRRGVCMRGGRVLIAGDVWGKDMILSNPLLREAASVRCLSYLEVLTLRFADLQDCVSRSSQGRALVRWWQIRLALQHAMQRISRAVRQMERREGSFADMPADTQKKVVLNVLHGHSPLAELPSEETCSNASAGLAGNQLEEIKSSILALTQTVESLQQTVLDMAE